MIRYFRKSLRPSIRAQLDVQSRDLDSWEEVIEKAVNAEAKALLQSPASTRDIDSRCPQGNKSTKKEEKDSKNKSTDSTPTDTSSRKQLSPTQQTSSPHPKIGGSWHGRGRGQDSPATGVNANPKKEELDLSQVDCFHCRKKGHDANRCLQKKKKQESKT